MNWIDRPIQPTKRHPKYGTEAERQAARKRSRLKAYEASREETAAAKAGRTCAGLGNPKHVNVPPDILADAERIRHMEHPSIVGRLTGDPMPGRSALDRMRD